MSLLAKKAVKAIIHLPRRVTGFLRREPNFLIIGAQKAGTTSLHYYLNQHPDVAMSSLKEVHYFDANYRKGRNWYRSYFPLLMNARAKCVGEASPYYLFHPEVPSRVRENYPQVKIIILLREPASRALSQYKMERRKGRENIETFSAALGAERQRMFDAVERMSTKPLKLDFEHQAYSYISRGMYYEQISRWLKYFDKRNFLVLESDVLFRDPKRCLSHVYEFLGVGEIFPEDLTAMNKGGDAEGNGDSLPEGFRTAFEEDQRLLKELLNDMDYVK